MLEPNYRYFRSLIPVCPCPHPTGLLRRTLHKLWCSTGVLRRELCTQNTTQIRDTCGQVRNSNYPGTSTRGGKGKRMHIGSLDYTAHKCKCKIVLNVAEICPIIVSCLANNLFPSHLISTLPWYSTLPSCAAHSDCHKLNAQETPAGKYCISSGSNRS